MNTEQQEDRRVDRNGFPDRPNEGSHQLPGTIANLAHLLAAHAIKVTWDVIRKRIVIARANGTETSINRLLSLCALNGFPTGNLYPFVQELGQSNPFNPVTDWVRSKAWDGEDRLPALYATVTAEQDYPDELKQKLLYRWLLSATAAVLTDGRFHARGVLTLQGPQGTGKTSWVRQLVPPGNLRETCIKLDHQLDGGNKDSIILAIQHWIVEVGELDSTFRKDVARLKGFLTRDCDKLRPPYGRSVQEYPRRTVFAATVNDDKFLVDRTGNSRFWTIPVVSLRYDHDIDMQQLFAQLAVRFDAGDQWWLTASEDRLLAEWNKRHLAESAIAERVRDYLDRHAEASKRYSVTASKFLDLIGIRSPSNTQCKECGAVLREVLGPPKRINGRDRWSVPIADVTKIDPEPLEY